MESILFYYNSLPEFPKACTLIREKGLLLRDFFKCNPRNTGHYEYPKFEEHSYDEGCHRREVAKILDRGDKDFYVLFYSRYTKLDDSSENRLIGFYQIGKIIERDGKRGFQSKKTILLDKDAMKPIKYSSRGVPVSWGRSKISGELNSRVDEVKKLSKFNCEAKFQTETRRIMSILSDDDKRRKMVDDCLRCNNKSCYLLKKLNRNPGYLDELYPIGGRGCES